MRAGRIKLINEQLASSPISDECVVSCLLPSTGVSWSHVG